MARQTFLIIAISLSLLAVTPAAATNYPIDGRWGVTASTQKGPIDCSKLRVITFNGSQRTDSGGGVPAFRNHSIQSNGSSDFRIVDVFTTGQISNGQAKYTLKIIEADRVEINQQPGGVLKLRKCK
ncbi:hypothetical protein [Undibacter mobilis]|uniref:Uncharacterized protein n=1 Tax=Undibacter mobilis TaxID=2292256 RepID=A0A371BBI5_9BRAD|nr:hypothetical protein [Undibacter mobilis]RDV04946.1 hypothetical protein DXH78_10455 [Undibacter mobilis]